MIKIVAISDTHGYEIPHLPSADILIHSGDWSGLGSEQESNNFIDWMDRIHHKYAMIYAVPGNHDIWVYHNERLAKERFLEADINLLIDEESVYKGLRFYGMPHSPQFGQWAYMPSVEKREMAVKAIPYGTDVLITHAPPHMILDKLDEYGSSPGSHVGCTFLANRVETIEPKLHVFGHIHNQSGVISKGNTLFVNAASVTEEYKPLQGYKVIYLD